MVVRVENLNLENASILHIKYWSTILVPGTGTLPGTWYWYQHIEYTSMVPVPGTR